MVDKSLKEIIQSMTNTVSVWFSAVQ